MRNVQKSQIHNDNCPTLFHSKNTCSQAVLIAAAEGAVELRREPVKLGEKKLSDGGSFYDINPLGQVASLKFVDGTLLTENTAILMWVQGQSRKEKFRRPPGSPEYFQVLRWVSFVSTEIHKAVFRVVFYDEATEAGKDRFRVTGMKRLAVVDDHLTGRNFLVGSHFSVADAYLTWALNLAPRAALDFSGLIQICSYRDRMMARPAIAKVIAADHA